MTEVLIVGAGPAGAAAALTLARLGVPVTLVDRTATPSWQIGESLPGAARRVLSALGALDRFRAAGHAPAPLRMSRWGSDELEILDAFRDPDGVGWHLDRTRFETDLRSDAVQAGARLVAPARLTRLDRCPGGWHVTLDRGQALRARLIIDATGRRSRLLGAFGQRAAVQDRLVCVYQTGPVTGEPDLATYTQATEHGWWYTAALPDRRRLVAFYGDADQSEVRRIYRQGPLQTAGTIPGLRDVLGDLRTHDWHVPAVCAAHSVARSAAGTDWFAVGDSVIALDPLSSQGLLNALITGLECGHAVHAALRGDRMAARRYAQAIGQVWQAYRTHHATFYAAEQRWPDAPFWLRRHGSAPPPPAQAEERSKPGASVMSG
ncbi:tryptophan 7-halogenase [Deinococcus xianganensis]|uniref:FAD-dependent oxidoreductase n=1 Tax=Deinococcus xianganensis TaxID=1507289 RepID=A0A6I4YU16_9DEIO|nr:FAD-dependent oxidoreductase [Deinococcus xianganensis]